MTSSSTFCPNSPPLAVQVGFAGSRQLFERDNPRVQPRDFEEAVVAQLVECLSRLPAELGLSSNHFLCGISQAAVGGDVAFLEACGELNIPQRIFLPQQRDYFLSATSEEGVPDFTPEEAVVVRSLLDSPQIIEEQVVTHAPLRHERFEEVNLEIVRQSDVVVCLLRANAEQKAGGSGDLIMRAENRDKPVLIIHVSVQDDGRPRFDSQWRQRDKFRVPELPEELAGLDASLPAIPPVADYCQALKDFASHAALGRQSRFKTAALVIIGTHILATTLAVIAAYTHNEALPWLLGVELVLLAIGFRTHNSLHRSHSARVWGMSRLAAEIGRSVQAMNAVPCDLAHLFRTPLPDSLGALTRTLNVLHLRAVRAAGIDWRKCREGYVVKRLTHDEHGQLAYYARRRRHAAVELGLAHWAFIIASASAILATLAKLLMHTEVVHVPEPTHELFMKILGGLAIILPVFAVGGLSLAAALDLEARKHTYGEMLDFLKRQVHLLQNCTTQREFSTLVMETESRLVTENAVWFSRRAYIGVA
jgi:hypothetical protein